MTTTRRFAISLAVATSLTLAWSAPAIAAVHSWIGPTNGLWSNAANWNGASKPTSGEPGGTIVKFGSNTTSTMDIAGLTIDQIDFTGANNTINGSTTLTVNGAILTDNVVSEGEKNTLSATLPLTLTGASLEATSSTGMLTLAGAIAGAPGMVFNSTGGEFDLIGQNTYAGATFIAAGKLHISNPIGTVITGSGITIANGLGQGAELVLDQSSDISTETPITVNSGGVMNFDGFSDFAKSLTVNGGTVVGATLTMSGALTLLGGEVGIASSLSAGSLAMTGGRLSGPGTLALAGNIQATSNASQGAAISSGVKLLASPTVTVNAGTPPELMLTGPISEFGGSRSITKTGVGTMVTTASNSYTGTTTISAGKLVADGLQTGPFVVGAGGTLEGSGSAGATNVEGILAPIAPGFRTGSLSFGPAGRLDDTILSTAGSIPSAIVTGTVVINPSAALDLVFAPAVALPHGSALPLIENDGTEPIEGHFSGVPTGSVLSTFEAVPLLVSYAGGSGNDMTLTAGNVPPQAGSVEATPKPATAGQPVALHVAASDPNQDPLTTSWNFGDGTSASGTAVMHTYAKAGEYTVVATVSDGLSQVQSTSSIAVTAPAAAAPAAGPTSEAVPNNAAGATATTTSSDFGATFGLTVTRGCLRSGTSFTATLGVQQLKGKVSAGTLRKVTLVVFTVAGKGPQNARHAPFTAHLTVPHLKSGAGVRVRAAAHVILRNGKHRTESVTTVVKVC